MNSYSYQVFVIHIYSVSAPPIVASGHMDATPAYALSHTHSGGGGRR